MKTIKYKGADEAIYYEKLSNGLEVFMYPSDTAKNFYLAFNVKYGSMHTSFKSGKEKKFTKVPNGTAHFLEHQMFEEDNGKSAFEYYSQLGSSINAFTTYDFTSYEVVASANFKENLDYLLDYVQNPVFKTSGVNKERGIIKEEIKMYDNNPMSVLYFGLENNLNNLDNHKYLISGTEDDIKEITPEILNRVYDVFYHPGNMFLVLTGKFNPLEALGIIKANQGKKNFKPKTKFTINREKEPLEVQKSYEEKKMDVGVPKLKIAYKLDKHKFKGIDDVMLKIYLNAIMQLKFGSTSDLLEKLIDEKLIPWNLYPLEELRNDYVVLAIETETEYKEEVIDLVRNEFNNIKISDEELKRVIKVNKANFLMHFNDIVNVAENLEDDIINYGKVVDNILDLYDNMNLKDINTIASMITTDNECILYIDKMTV